MSEYTTQNIELCAAYAEIARLKKEAAFQTDMADQADVACLRLKSVNADLQRECMARGERIADLEKLVIHAADEAESYIFDDDSNVGTYDISVLIAELRKAAQ